MKKHNFIGLFMAILALVLVVLPTTEIKAATKYSLTSDGSSKKVVMFEQGNEENLYVVLKKNGKEVNLKKNKKIKVSWKSSNNKVVKIEDTYTGYSEYDGAVYNSIYAKVTPVSKGTATVTASYKGASYSYKVTVRKAGMCLSGTTSKTAYVPVGLKIGLSLNGGGWDQLESEDIKLTSKNTSIAKVKGKYAYEYAVQGVKEGTTNIVAKSRLGTLKLKVVVLPKYDVQVKNLKSVKKNGKIVGYSFDVTNKGKKDVTILSGGYGDVYGFSIGKLKDGKVTVKAGKSKKITVSDSSAVYGVDGCTPGINVKYAGHKFLIWYDEKGKPMTVYAK